MDRAVSAELASIADLQSWVNNLSVNKLKELFRHIYLRNTYSKKSDLIQNICAYLDRQKIVPKKTRSKIYNLRFEPYSNSYDLPVPSSVIKSLPDPALVASRSVEDNSTRVAGKSNATIEPSPLLCVKPNVLPEEFCFSETIASLLSPTLLCLSNPSSKFQRQCFEFHLTNEQAEQILIHRRRNMFTNTAEYGVQVQMRCVNMTSAPHQDAFPVGIAIKVNSGQVQLPPPLASNKPGADPIRPGRPLNICGLCRISPMVSNNVLVEWTHNLTSPVPNYCIFIDLVTCFTPQDLILKLLVKPKEFGIALVREKLLPSDAELDLAVTDLYASLKCPLGKMRIKTPIRSGNCSHLQCFDAYSFLAMNEKKPKWRCPFCDCHAPFSTLYVDNLFKCILTSTVRQAEKIQFDVNGQWKVIEVCNDDELVDTPSADTNGCSESDTKSDIVVVVETVDLTNSSDEETAAEKEDQTSEETSNETYISPTKWASGSNSNSNPEVIILDSDDDDSSSDSSELNVAKRLKMS